MSAVLPREILIGPEIDPLNDHPIRVRALANYYGIKFSTFRSLYHFGRVSATGKRVKLRTIKMPTGVCSSHKAYQEFLALVSSTESTGNLPAPSKWEGRRFIIEDGAAYFRFTPHDLRWLYSQMKSDDVLRFEFAQAMEEIA